MKIQLGSGETYIWPLEVWKENITKKILELKYLVKLFQNEKVKSELTSFQSIVKAFSSPISERGGGGGNFQKIA